MQDRTASLLDSDIRPVLSPNYVNHTFMFPFEEKFQYLDSKSWMQKNWTWSFWCCGIYMIVIFAGKRLMQNRERFTLRKALIAWNILLATISIIGAFRTAPELIHVLQNYGIYHSVCEPSFLEVNKVSSFWSWIFALSKVPELGDTIFIILRKQKLIFLHWYHHMTVLLYSWYAYKEFTSSARWFCVMNYCIHSLMYFYYALQAMGKRPPKATAIALTSLQISQMAMGLLVNVWSLQYINVGHPCQVSRFNILLSVLMYLSYFGLFLRFFINAYLKSESHKKKKS